MTPLQEIVADLFTPAWPEIIKWINGELDEETKRDYEKDYLAMDKKMRFLEQIEEGWDLEQVPKEFKLDDIRKGMVLHVGGPKGAIDILVQDVSEDGIYGWSIVFPSYEPYCNLDQDDIKISMFDIDEYEIIVQTWCPMTVDPSAVIEVIGNVKDKNNYIMEFMEEWIHGEREVEEPKEEYKRLYREIFRKFKDSLAE